MPPPRVVFVWVDPRAPLSDNSSVPLPEPYAAHVTAWGSRYDTTPVVLFGHTCEAAVMAAEKEADAPGLHVLYLRLAGQGKWIYCVDIARVADLYLHGGMYLDTDMALGGAPLPPAVVSPAVAFFPRDDDGLLQNNFIAAPRHHPFLRLLLQVYARHADTERHVVDATGPVAVTAVYNLWRGGVLQPDGSPSTAAAVVHTIPPHRFYTHHWYTFAAPADAAAARSPADCYGVHGWDVSWGRGSAAYAAPAADYDGTRADDYAGDCTYVYTTPLQTPSGGGAAAAYGVGGYGGQQPAYVGALAAGGAPEPLSPSWMQQRVAAVQARLASHMGCDATAAAAVTEGGAECPPPPTLLRLLPDDADTPAARRVAVRQLAVATRPPSLPAVSLVPIAMASGVSVSAQVAWGDIPADVWESVVAGRGACVTTDAALPPATVFPTVASQVWQWLWLCVGPHPDTVVRLAALASPPVVLLRGAVAGSGKTLFAAAMLRRAKALPGGRVVTVWVAGDGGGGGAASGCTTVTLADATAAVAAGRRCGAPVVVVVDDVATLAVDHGSAAVALALTSWTAAAGADAGPSAPRVRVLLTADAGDGLPAAVAGCVGQEVNLPVPRSSGRTALLRHHIASHGVAELPDEGVEAVLPSLCTACRGMSPRQLARVCRLAALVLRRGGGTTMPAALQHGVQAVIDVAAGGAWGSTAVRLQATRVAATGVALPHWPGFAGYDALKQRLTKLVLWPLRHPDRMRTFRLDTPRGVLLHGPPGCGKTAAVHALAHAGTLPLLTVKGPELLSRYVGESEAALRRLFDRARALAPCLLFLDEVDAMAAKRSFAADGGGDGKDVHDRVLSTLLNELDGVDTGKGVIVVAATSRKDAVDAALLRPGRVDVVLEVAPPTAASRLAILQSLAANRPLANDVDIEAMAGDDWWPTATGGDLSALWREAGLQALRRDIDAEAVCAADFDAAKALLTS